MSSNPAVPSGAVRMHQPSRVPCSAAYSTPCSRSNSQFLATQTSQHLQIQDNNGVYWTSYLSDLTDKIYNRDDGFYPFVFDAETGVCLAHGSDPSLVNLTMEEIFGKFSIQSDASATHARFVNAALSPENSDYSWAQYLWNDNGANQKKMAYLAHFWATDNAGDRKLFYLGVGHQDKQLPPDLPCSADHDSWCSHTNVRSLVGAAQTHLIQAFRSSLSSYETALFDLSKKWRIDEGFYTFLVSFDGVLRAHPTLAAGATIGETFEKNGLGTDEQGWELHERFLSAANGLDGIGWARYPWPDQDGRTRTKTALVTKITLGGEDHYLGAGYYLDLGDTLSDPFGGHCSDTSSSPCAFKTALQLASHAASYAISSQQHNITTTFESFTHDPRFRVGDFYLFMGDFHSGTCVAHGGNTSFVNRTVPEIFADMGLALNATELHEQFRSIAESGGGFLEYDWVKPGVENSRFKKISYVFRLTIEGIDYYAGVGYNRAPIQAATPGRQWDDEVVLQALIGEAVTRLTIASSVTAAAGRDDIHNALDVVFNSITNKEDDSLYKNDLLTMVFAMNAESSSVCSTSDNTGCCVAHGGNASLVGMSWQEILDVHGVVIPGVSLHKQLMDASAGGCGDITYPWKQRQPQLRGGSKATLTFKHAWACQFSTNDGSRYYVVAEQLTCDRNAGFDCSHYKTDLDAPALIVSLAAGVMIAVLSCCIHHGKRKWQARVHELEKNNRDDNQLAKAEMNEMAQKLDEKAQETRRLETDILGALQRLEMEEEKIRLLEAEHHEQGRKLRVKENDVLRLQEVNDTLATRVENELVHVVEVVDDFYFFQSPTTSPSHQNKQPPLWYWEEDNGKVGNHPAALSGTNFVGYTASISNRIEKAYQQWLTGDGDRVFHHCHRGVEYALDLEALVQRNRTTQRERKLHRQEDIPPDGECMSIARWCWKRDAENEPLLLDLPADISCESAEESILPLFRGQLIQVTQVHQKGDWMYGNLLYDPLIHGAEEENADDDSQHWKGPFSGWFPKARTQSAKSSVLQTKLFDRIGGDELVANLATPVTWEKAAGVLFVVTACSPEFHAVSGFFQKSQRRNQQTEIAKIERVQNKALWQSYQVKKHAMRMRNIERRRKPKQRVHGNNGTVERKWLFHGTTPDAALKIVQHGFNRSHAGRTRHGKGCYFARDAAYASHESYATRERVTGLQRVFLCRVAVGDWCQGSADLVAPPCKPQSTELFDSTVNKVKDPSVFVAYHDAQAYPEYLVTFRQGRTNAT